MASAPLRGESTVFARSACLCISFFSLIACRERGPAPQEMLSRAPAAASAAPTPARIRRPAPAGDFSCRELRSPPQKEELLEPETIELRPPSRGKQVFTSKTGVVLSFDREEFLKAAQCLKFEKAVRYLEEETGVLEQSALMDAFQLSYVVAAMLDIGRASVRLDQESVPRKEIVRDAWAADGCAGNCRSFGRLYRLSAEDSFFFLRITDQTVNSRAGRAP
jgi:hypothetical protein